VSRRTERIAALMRQELSRIILSHLSDPRIGFVTLTRVDVAPDLSLARVQVSVLGTPTQQQTALQGLNSARRRIQRDLGDAVELRRVPELVFHLDPGVKHSIRISSLLAELAREGAPAEEKAPEESPEDGETSPEGETEETQDHDR
jgi:ribosome-binding factor A